METMTAFDADRRFPAERRGPPRRVVSAVVVAGVYGLLVLGAPLLLRYGPEPEVSAAVARVALEDVAASRCGFVSENARPCAPEAAPVRAQGKAAVFTE